MALAQEIRQGGRVVAARLRNEDNSAAWESSVQGCVCDFPGLCECRDGLRREQALVRPSAPRELLPGDHEVEKDSRRRTDRHDKEDFLPEKADGQGRAEEPWAGYAAFSSRISRARVPPMQGEFAPTRVGHGYD